jgi:REP element-mobilizing transposase RayT
MPFGCFRPRSLLPRVETEAKALGYILAPDPRLNRNLPHMYELKIKRIWHTQLPHWEVERGVYFITIRCAGSLPLSVKHSIIEIQKSLAEIESNDKEFQQLQRQYFLTLEKYLDTSQGFAPYTNDTCCQMTVDSFETLKSVGWDVRHFAIMPNHIHLVVWSENAADMATTWKEWKGRIAFRCNQVLKRKGAFWQNDWFDRVCRNESETNRVIAYVQTNPTKARLPKTYKWVQ